MYIIICVNNILYSFDKSEIAFSGIIVALNALVLLLHSSLSRPRLSGREKKFTPYKSAKKNRKLDPTTRPYATHTHAH